MPKLGQYTPAIDRFNKRWTLNANTGCWDWTGHLDNGGYGMMWGGKELGKEDNVLAHRAAWFLFKGHDPAELCVLHHCDNPRCVNPDHLFLGTNKDNTQDMIGKGRHLLGAAWKRSRLTDDDIRAIRLRSRDRPERLKLAAEYGVNERTIFDIQTGDTWKHVT